MTDLPDFSLRSAPTPDRLMEELEKFIVFWIGPRREEYGVPGEILTVGPIMEMESASITKTACALGGWAGCEVIGAYTNAARHAAKNAESDRARSMAWPSLARTSRPGVRAW